MRQISMFVLGVVFFACNSINGGNTDQLSQVYQNKLKGFQFKYPQNWTLVDDFQKNGYLALYSPEALSTRKKTLDLVTGLKIEFQIMSDLEIQQSLSRMKPCTKLQTADNQAKELQIYCLEKTDCLYIDAILSINKYQFLAMGYLPEQAGQSRLQQTYNQIILSFSELKSGSD